MPQPGDAAAQVERIVRQRVVVADLADDAAALDVALLALHADVAGDVGHREPRLDVLELDAVGVHARIAAGARRLNRRRGLPLLVVAEFVEHLRVPEEEHAVRPPVVDDVREHVDVHELAVRLAGADLLPLPPGVTETNRREARVPADAEHVELELTLDVAVRGRQLALDTEPALARAQIEAPVLAELLLEGRQLRRAIDVIPVRVVLLEVGDRVSLAEAVDLERPFVCGRLQGAKPFPPRSGRRHRRRGRRVGGGRRSGRGRRRSRLRGVGQRCRRQRQPHRRRRRRLNRSLRPSRGRSSDQHEKSKAGHPDDLTLQRSYHVHVHRLLERSTIHFTCVRSHSRTRLRPSSKIRS